MREACARLARDTVVRPILVSTDTECAPGVTCSHPETSGHSERYAQIYYERRRHRGLTEAEAQETATTSLYYAALALENGDADGLVGGAKNTTGQTVRAPSSNASAFDRNTSWCPASWCSCIRTSNLAPTA